MKLLPIILLVVAVKYSLGNVDIFNKCPDFNPINNFDIEEVICAIFMSSPDTSCFPHCAFSNLL